MRNRVEDLRNILFAQLEKLSDCDQKDLGDEVKRSAAMCEVAQSIIDSARAQTDFLSRLKNGGIDFYQKKIQNTETDNDEPDDDLINYGGKMISKKTLGNRPATSANKD